MYKVCYKKGVRLIMNKDSHKAQMVLMMITGAFAIFFTGSIYVWPIYQPYIIEMTGWTVSQASMCFYLSSCFFVVGNIIGGRIQDKRNPRLVLFIGGAIFSAGVLLSAFLLLPTPYLMYLTYGVMQGFGQGMLYSTILATAQKWFPSRPGFASGCVITANGLSALIMAPLSRTLLQQGGPKLGLLVSGSLIAIAWILSSVFFVVPKKEWIKDVVPANKNTAHKVKPKQYTSKEMVHTKKFYFMVLTMIFGLLPYYLLTPVSQSLQISQGVAETVAVTSVMLGSICNAGTRLVLPTLADKIGRTKCIISVLIVAFIAGTLLTFGHSYAITVAVVIMYIAFGGIMGNFPSLACATFGIDNFGGNYGIIMIGMIITSLGSPYVIKFITGSGLGMNTVFAIGTICSLIAILTISLLQREINKDLVE